MSAWRIGTLNGVRRTRQVAADAEVPRDETAEAPAGIDTLVAWIPGEVIAAYAAIVLALQPEQKDGTEPPPVEITGYGWLLGGVAFAAALTLLGGWSKTDDLDSKATRELGTRVFLAATAFAIWSFVVPGSWWYSIDRIAENQKIIPIVAGLVGAVFALFAEGLVRRVAR